MQTPQLIFDNSPAYLILFAAFGALIAWFFYQKDQKTWGINVRRTLFVLRSILLFFVLALLLSPLLKYLANENHPPVSLIVFDNSESIIKTTDSTTLQNLFIWGQDLADELPNDHEVFLSNLRVEPLEDWADLTFIEQETNLHQAFKTIESKFESRNLKSVILITDGIFNAGISPTYFEYDFDIFTIGIGDTTRRKDLAIKDVRHNEISYQGNQFPIQADVFNEGYKNETANLSLLYNGRVLETKPVTFQSNQQSQTFTFLVEAKEKGNQRYQLRLSQKEDEFNKQNNSRSLFIEVVEGKENILAVTRFPDPDIKAIRAALETNENYSFEVYTVGISKAFPKENNYDLIILNEMLPDDPLFSNLGNLNITETARMIILPERMNFRRLNDLFKIEMNMVSNEFDMVTPAPNTAFNHFSTTSELNQLMSKLPPVKVPFGDIGMPTDMEALLYQRVGNIETQKPLLIISGESPKTGIFLGQGLWRWRMHDFYLNENHGRFNELIQKIVQFLSTKNDTRKLRVKPVEESISEQSIVMENEIYNDLLERVFDIPIELTVEDETGEKTVFQYSTSQANTRYRISGLNPGIYNYTARAEIGGEMESTNGQFVLKNTQMELLELRADHELLKRLSQRNQGTFVNATQTDSLLNVIRNRNYTSIIKAQQTFEPIINLYWVLMIIIAFAGVEWFLRKYFGGY